MSPKVPQNFDEAFLAKVDILIQNVEHIDTSLNPHDDYGTVPEKKLFAEYCVWLEEVQKVFNTDDLKQYLPHNFFFTKQLQVPQLRYDEKVVGNKAHTLKLKRFRVQLHNEILKQITSLRDIKSEYRKREMKILIHVENDGKIWRDDPEKYFHRSTSGQTKRVRMLKILAKNNVHTKTSTLLKQLRYGSVSTLSREKGELNKKLRKHLDLSQDVILGGVQTRNKGYIINPAFEIVIHTKRHLS